jgi:Mg2+-importing ATPase
VRACPVHDIVRGDVVELAAGSLIPADGVLLKAHDCFVIQAVLTGESAPAEKTTAPTAANAALVARSNVVFMGTSVRSGTGVMLVVRTGARTAFGSIASRLKLRRPETDFERGIRRFSTLLTEFVLLLTVIVMSINLMLDRPALDSLLFAIALAVGITPELLPAIVSYTLSRGARELAKQGVLTRRLAAIENLGSMDVLCSDKTGTLTIGAARLHGAVDVDGQAQQRVLDLGVINARLQTGLTNPLDEVLIEAAGTLPTPTAIKLDECPYDFVRKRMSVAVREAEGAPCLTITKGAAPSVLAVSVRVRSGGELLELDDDARERILAALEMHAREGFRVLGVASHEGSGTIASETDMTFEGFLLFEDPTKPDIIETLKDLKSLGVHLKMVTGDNRHTALHVARAVGIEQPACLSGDELPLLSDEALWQRAPHVDVFAEVDPNQKERIILALRKAGHVVGYLGDGINDAPALHAADVGISVDGAVDVAKEAADIVLLEHDLAAISRGIRQGRTTFANTQKYILSTTSANFGNMLSMAAASAFLPFLPLLAPQILLNNLLTDIPALALAGDRVDAELVEGPPRWSMQRIRRFTLVFGCLSSLFDLFTFAALLWLLGSVPERFRSGWFLESLATEILVLFAIRTQRPLFASAPTRTLLLLSALVLVGAFLFVQTPLGPWLGFESLTIRTLCVLGAITVAYVASVEVTKRPLYGLTQASGASAVLRGQT